MARRGSASEGAGRAVFFDRDGVLNAPLVRDGRAYAPLSLEQFHIVPDAREAVARVQVAGFLAVVVTNQPEVARRTLRCADLDAMHRVLRDVVGVDGIYVCPHLPDANCGCHKPARGLLDLAVRDLGIDLERSYVIGDRWRDVGAGKAAGCTTILIEQDYSLVGRPPGFTDEPDLSAGSLSRAIDRLLELEQARQSR